MEQMIQITGKDRSDIFNQLVKDKTLVRIRALNGRYEQITMVLSLRGKKERFFRIDSPKQFDEVFHGIKTQAFEFEFKNTDDIKHVFKSLGGERSGNEIWIRFPEFVERIQRRSDYRVTFPEGTFVRFKIGVKEYQLNVINISLGGMFAEMMIVPSVFHDNPTLFAGGFLDDIELVCPSEDNTVVRIKKVLVLRAYKYPETDRFYMALEFLKMDEAELELMRELIYNVQRNYLQNRIKVNM